MENCIFCHFKDDDSGTTLFEDDFCACIEYDDKVLVGSCCIIPKAHKATVFDLSFEEWESTKLLIDKVKVYLDEKYCPNGYNVGWNCGAVGGQIVFHAHLHIIPRYADEPFAGRGIRSWIKREDNMRPSLR